MYIRDLPGQEGLASQSHLRAGTTCSARQGKGQPDRAYLAIRLRDGGRDDFRVYASETVTTRPGSVPEAHRADGHGPLLGLMGIEGAKPATIRSAERAMMGWLISEGGRRLVHLMGSSNGIF